MAEAFNSLGNHLVSDSAAAINAGDDLSTIGTEDASVLGRNGLGTVGAGRRRGGDDDEAELYDDDDLESLISQPINGVNGSKEEKAEDEIELPAHACACVHEMILLVLSSRILTTFADTAASITLLV